MREQINRYARGTFEYDVSAIRLNENRIHGIVDLNRGYEGKISFDEVHGRPIKGVVYSSNDKVVLRTGTFSGEKIELPYYVKCNGTMSEADIIGEFCIVSNAGEYVVPYSFTITAGSFDTTIGQIRTLEQFTELYMENPAEAAEIFEAADFKDVFIGSDLKLRNAYDCIIKGQDVHCNVEEFLVCAHQKNRIKYSIQTPNITYNDCTENFKDSVIFERDGFGYSRVFVRTDCDFIKLERSIIDSDMFIGNQCELQYIIDVAALHEGWNLGRIFFETSGGRHEYKVSARQKDETGSNQRKNEIKHLDAELMAIYISFRTHKINVSEWTRDSGIVLEKIRELEDTNPFYRLAQAQLDIVSHNEEKAKELIEDVKDEIEPRNPEEFPLYCYFIYINTLYNKDRAYSKRAAAVVRECYNINEDWRILWTLLFMDEELEQNPSLKLLRLKEQFNKGCTSPVIYIEACNILNANVGLLRVLNSFETNVLLFGAANGILNEKLTDMAVEMLLGKRTATRTHIKLLETFYNLSGDVKILTCLCKLFIRMGEVGKKVLPYYEKAIENELKITQLFEYYIMSRDREDMSPLPKMLLMYFGYNNELDYRQKSYLYANIIYNRDENIQVYQAYLSQIQMFVERQLMAGHINNELAKIYSHIANPDVINNENAGQISEIYFTYKVECRNPFAKGVIIRHKESRSEKEYSFVSGVAYVRIYTEDAAVIIVDNEDRRYAAGMDYTITRLLDNNDMMQLCLQNDPGLVHVKMSFCDRIIRYPQKRMDAVEFITGMIDMPEINKYYRDCLVSYVIDYYYDNYDADGFDEFVEKVRFDRMSDCDVTKLVEIYITEGRYKEAFRLIEKYCAGYIIPKRLAKLCQKTITEIPVTNEMLIKYTYDAFDNGYADENMIDFLSKYYNGPTGNMVKLWRKASMFDFDTYDLEERIIAQMLFTHNCSEDIYEIFENYYAKGPKDRVVEAYLSYHAYRYFVHLIDVDESVFDMIEVSLENEGNLANICKIALLKFYVTKDSLNEFRKETASALVRELSRKALVFPFFRELKKFITLPFDINDKTMIEYRANPSDKIIIHYEVMSSEEGKKYVSEEMTNVYEGIFVKQFVMFYGEGLRYYISKETDEGEEVLENRTIENTETNPEKSVSRYEKINDMIECNGIKDRETMLKLMHSYAVTDCVTRQLFKPL